MLVAEETGRVLAPVPFLGLVPATAILDAAGYDGLAAIASGEVRPVWIPTRPPGDLEPQWTVDGPGAARPAAPTISGEGDSVTVTGHAAYVVDAPGADLLVVTGVDGTVAVVDASAAGVTVEQVVRYDVTRALAHVTLDNAPGTRLAVDAAVPADAWYVAQALIAAEAVGTVQTTLEMSVQYAKERFTFGRAIGSYQAVKHELTEVLRRLENAPLAALLRRVVTGRRTGRVPAGGKRRAVGGRRCAGLRRALEHQRARRHRRDVGARRPAVLPPRPADPPPDRRPRRRDRSRGRAASRSLSAETNRAGGKALPTGAGGCYGAATGGAGRSTATSAWGRKCLQQLHTWRARPWRRAL